MRYQTCQIKKNREKIYFVQSEQFNAIAQILVH